MCIRDSFKHKLLDAIYTRWAQEWYNNPTCCLSKYFLPTPSKTKSKTLLKLNRGQMRTLIELITGHNNLNYFQSKIHPEISGNCRFCEEEDETFEHLLNDCPCFLIARRDLLQNNTITNTLAWDPKTLLKFSELPSISQALTDNHAD